MSNNNSNSDLRNRLARLTENLRHDPVTAKLFSSGGSSASSSPPQNMNTSNTTTNSAAFSSPDRLTAAGSPPGSGNRVGGAGSPFGAGRRPIQLSPNALAHENSAIQMPSSAHANNSNAIRQLASALGGTVAPKPKNPSVRNLVNKYLREKHQRIIHQHQNDDSTIRSRSSPHGRRHQQQQQEKIDSDGQLGSLAEVALAALIKKKRSVSAETGLERAHKEAQHSLGEQQNDDQQQEQPSISPEPLRPGHQRIRIPPSPQPPPPPNALHEIALDSNANTESGTMRPPGDGMHRTDTASPGQLPNSKNDNSQQGVRFGQTEWIDDPRAASPSVAVGGADCVTWEDPTPSPKQKDNNNNNNNVSSTSSGGPTLFAAAFDDDGRIDQPPPAIYDATLPTPWQAYAVMNEHISKSPKASPLMGSDSPLDATVNNNSNSFSSPTNILHSGRHASARTLQQPAVTLDLQHDNTTRLLSAMSWRHSHSRLDALVLSVMHTVDHSVAKREDGA